jgi:hypothetical protein
MSMGDMVGNRGNGKVGISTSYGLDDRGDGVRVPVGLNFVLSTSGSGFHPASYPVGSGEVTGVKQLGHEPDYSSPTSAKVKKT